MWPAQAFNLPHHFEVLFIFLFLRVLLNNPPSSFSPGVHENPYQHSCPVQHSVYRCVSSVCVSSPAGCSTPASTRPTKYTSGELLALQTPVHLEPELVATLKSLGIGRQLPRRRSCSGGARKTRAISVVGPSSVRSRPCDLLPSPHCDLSPSTTPASFCHHLPRPLPPPACNPISCRLTYDPKTRSRPCQPASPSLLSMRNHWELCENAPSSVISSMNTT